MIIDKAQLIRVLGALRADKPPMTVKQYQAAIDQIGISQKKAGPYFGYAARTGQRWASGALPIPFPVAWALRFMVDNGLTAEEFTKA